MEQELKPFCLNHKSKGLPFLGYVVFPYKVKLAKRSKKRFIKKMSFYFHNLRAGIWDQDEFQNHCLPLLAFTEYANCMEFRKEVLEKINRQLPQALIV